MSRYLSGRYRELREYVPGEQPFDRRYIKLNTNESPYPPPPAVTERIQAEEMRNLKLYSDPDARILREKLAALYGVQAENILVTNGSDEALHFAFMAYADKGAIFPDITYGFYRVFAQLCGVPYRMPSLRHDFTVDPADYLDAHGAMIVIANPNAPTGLFLPVSEIERIVEANSDSVVVIDEAYVDFGGESAIPLLERYENLLVVQTFSKSRSMAGARVGFAIGHASLIGDLNRLRCSTNPYNVNRLSLTAAESAVDAQSYFDENCRKIITVRDETARKLSRMGFSLTDSRANFLFARTDQMEGAALYRALRARGILVRHFDAPRIADYNRITVGSPEEMETLVAAIADILAAEKGEKNERINGNT